MPRKPRSLAALAALSLCLLAALPQPAPASFPGKPGMIVFNPSNAPYVLDPAGGLYGIQPWRTERRQLTWNPSDNSPSFAPSGKQLAFQRPKAHRPGIYILDLETEAKQRIAAGAEPAFGRKGMVAFVRTTAIGRDLFLRAADGGLRRLTSTPNASEESPIFTPDGERIVFVRKYGSFRDQRLFSIDIAGSGLRDLGPARYVYNLDISPNGRTVAFETLDFGTAAKLGSAVGTRRLSDGDIRSVERNAADPVFSPGGGKIAFEDLEGIWLGPVDGDGPKHLIYRIQTPPFNASKGRVTDLAWQPLPAK